MLYRWFLDMDMVEEAFDASTFSRNRERLMQHEVAAGCFVGPAQPPLAVDALVFDRAGRPAFSFYVEQRIAVPLDAVSPHMIHAIVAEPEEGQIYKGTVVKIVDFGAFVNFFGSKDGLVHISQLAEQRVNKTTDVVKEGDKVWVKLLGFDDRGKVRLSMKVVDQSTGQEKSKEDATAE